MRTKVSLPDPRNCDVLTLTQALCDIPSVSGDEHAIANAIENLLVDIPHLEVLRDGDAIVARTQLGRSRRVIVAGHIDTVPVLDNLPTQIREADGQAMLWGRGTVDMKAGVAMALHTACVLAQPSVDVTWIFYDHEEVAADLNGLGRLARRHPEWLEADFAVLGEPSNGGIEGGCNGTLRVEVRTHGKAAHSGRAWMGHNAIHDAAEILQRLQDYQPGEVAVDGLVYREGLNAVLISGGVATNMIPHECVVTVNYRFAPDKSVEEALAHVREVFSGYELVLTDASASARPGLDDPLAQEFAAAVFAVTGGEPGPKYGWTDVARFAEMGIPAVNFGPGDPSLAHAAEEQVSVAQIRECTAALRSWLAAKTN